MSLQWLFHVLLFVSAILVGARVPAAASAYRHLDVQNNVRSVHPDNSLIQDQTDDDTEDIDDADPLEDDDGKAMIEAAAIEQVSGPHHMWIFKWKWIAGDRFWQTVECSLSLIFAGILCAAGGIGGGGIYVSVLMVIGRLSTHDAVPLSKAIVFFGALITLVLNMTKKSGPKIIDYNICRLVVPASLFGTLLGVFLNHIMSDWVIVTSLAIILILMFAAVAKRTVVQYMEAHKLHEEDAESTPILEGARKMGPETDVQGGEEQASHRFSGIHGNFTKHPIRFTLRTQDTITMGAMLFTVVVCGTIHYHAVECISDINDPSLSYPSACHHLLINPVFFHRMEALLNNLHVASFVTTMSMALPIFFCFTATTRYGRECIAYEGWSLLEVLQYTGMAAITGTLAGLVGIGGGLIFSPFFLIMGLEPSVAVATSSTCVLFTSSSTTMQYLLTDRIIVSLTLVYGLVNLVASYAGTKLVHQLQDHFSSRKYYITSIVALGVGISCGLALTKLYRTFEGHAQPLH